MFVYLEQLSSRGLQILLMLMEQYGTPLLLTLTVFVASASLLQLRNSVVPTPDVHLGRWLIFPISIAIHCAWGTKLICVVPKLLTDIAPLQSLVV